MAALQGTPGPSLQAGRWGAHAAARVGPPRRGWGILWDDLPLSFPAPGILSGSCQQLAPAHVALRGEQGAVDMSSHSPLLLGRRQGFSERETESGPGKCLLLRVLADRRWDRSQECGPSCWLVRVPTAPFGGAVIQPALASFHGNTCLQSPSTSPTYNCQRPGPWGGWQVAACRGLGAGGSLRPLGAACAWRGSVGSFSPGAPWAGAPCVQGSPGSRAMLSSFVPSNPGPC